MKFKIEDVFELVHKGKDDRPVEIVIPVKNEDFRVDYQIKGLKDNFKLVYLDGGSTDQTIKILIENDCTVYRRKDPFVGACYGKQSTSLAQEIFDAQNGTSWCISFYINYVSGADFILRLWADEYIRKDVQLQILEYLKNEKKGIYGARRDWFYGERLNIVASYPLCFRPSEAIWDDKVLHSDLLTKNPAISDKIFEVEHFSQCSSKENIAKLAKYTSAEIERITEGKKIYYPVFKRYFLTLLIPVKHWRKYKSMKLFFIDMLLHLVDCTIGHIFYIERYMLKNKDEQNKIFKQFTNTN
jgi:glycosyltransferase involved in cell wall biosynthesis